MDIKVYNTKDELGKAAASHAAEILKKSLQTKHSVNIILATGASQFETLSYLVKQPDIDWSKITMFHLDEYVGLRTQHPASFRKYLKERFVDKVNGLRDICFIEGDHADPYEECKRLNSIISDHSADLALAGIGENGHLAFNDPPADFETTEPYIVVDLDEACRKQQLGEGWFDSLEEVPRKAISMSIQHLLTSKHIICSVPDKRKSAAVKKCLEGEITPNYPASILQKHPGCHIYLDAESASLLSEKP